MLSALPLGFFPVDEVVDAANAVADAASYLYNNAGDVYNAVKKYGCMVVNNDYVMYAVEGGASLVASPGAGASIEAARQTGKQVCKAIKVAEGVLAVIKAQSGTTQPPGVPVPPPIQFLRVDRNALATIVPIYPAGSVARFNTTRKVFSIYKPGGLSGLGDYLFLGDPTPPPPGFVKAGESPTLPDGVKNAGNESDDDSLLKKPLFWVAVAGGVAAIGTAAYLVMR